VLATKGCSTFDQVVINEDLNLLKENEKELEKVMETIAKEYFRQVDYNFDRIPEMSRGEFEHVLPRLKGIDDDCYEKTMAKWSKWQPLRTKVTYGNVDYHVVHGDEWPGNFLTSKDRQSAYFMDFEDALFAEAKKEVSTVQSVGGDLASRIVSIKKTNDPDFTPAALNIFGSIGRLIAAVVQFGSTRSQVKENYIETFLSLTLAEFKEALENKNDALADNWEQFQTQILLHAWDWALYWIEKGRFRDPYAKRFIDEIKKLLCGEDAQTDEQKPITYPSPPDTGPRAMPSDNTEAREEKKIRDIIIEKADDDAWDSYSGGDLAKAEANWGIALQMLNEMKSNEDKGYFSYFKTKVAYLRNDDADKAVESLLQCIKFCQDDDDDAYLMEALLFLAYLRRISGTRTQAVGVLNQLVYLYNTGDFEESPESFDNEQLMEWPESEGDYKHTVLCQIKRMGANFFWKFGEYENASRLYENLMQYYEGTQQHDLSDNARVNLGILKSKLGEYEESDELQNQCLEYRRKEYAKVNDGDTGEITKALRNLGQNAMAWAKDLDQPEKNRKLEDAVGYFSECIELLEAQNEDFFVSPDQKEQFISFNIRLLQRCKLNIKIGDIYTLYEHKEERRKQFVELLPLFPSEQISIRLEIVEHTSQWESVSDQLDKIDYTECTAEQLFWIASTVMFKRSKFEEAKLLITQYIREFQYQTRIHCCRLLEEIYFRTQKRKIESTHITDYHRRLCTLYDVEYETEILEKLVAINNEWKLDDAYNFDMFVRPGLSDSEYESVIVGWNQLSVGQIREVGLHLLKYLLYMVSDLCLFLPDGGELIVVDPHAEGLVKDPNGYQFKASNPRRSRIEVAQTIFKHMTDLEILFDKWGILNLHMMFFNIAVNSLHILEREESLPANKRALRKHMIAYAKRTKEFKQGYLTSKELEVYKLVVRICVKPEEYPMHENLPKIIEKLQECETEVVKLSLLATIENIIQVSMSFGSPNMKLPPVNRIKPTARKCMNTIIDQLETWLILEPYAWSAQAIGVLDGDLRKIFGRTLLERNGDEPSKWPEVFKQTEQSEEEDLQEL
jgi:tetratricopeptide (TPR) repeat protein